jgi:hypothetical protein
MEQKPSVQNTVVIVGKAKSAGVAFLLSFLLGPLGLLYASVLGGIIMFFVTLVMFFILPIIGPVICWIGCIVWAVISANAANENARRQAEYYR